MKIEEVNEILSGLTEYELSNKYSKISESQPDNYYSEKYDGDNSEKIIIYRLGIEDWHLKLTLRTDSYGDNEIVAGVRFVKPIIKQVTDFE